MFTGIIEEVGTLTKIEPGRLIFKAARVLSDVQLGDSIAVSGVCLTVEKFTPDSFSASVMEETLKKTKLGLLEVGVPVNLERALALGGRLGGHLVSGHVDGLGGITSIRRLTNSTMVTIKPLADILPFIAAKGSITIDGVSLTVVDVKDEFTVSLVEHTLNSTTLGQAKVGEAVNLEVDVLARYVARLLAAGQQSNEPTSVEKLFKAGFIC